MRARGLGHLRLRGRIWWIQYSHRGTVYRESSHSPRRSDAARLLRQRLGEIARNRLIGPHEERVTFEDLAAGLLRNYELRGLRSLSTTQHRLNNLRRVFGTDRAVDITTARIEAYQARRRHAGAQGATINRELAALHRMFILACKNRLLSACPVFPDKLEENPPRQGFAEHSTYLVLRAHLPEDHGDVVDFGYFTGWRRREIDRLAWPRVDLDGKLIYLDSRHSKNKKSRTIPLPPPVYEILLRRHRKRRLGCDLVFHVDGQPLGDWRKTWKRACTRAGVPELRFHDFRRTAVRNLERAGVSREVAMAMTGHRTEAVYRRYNIVTERDLQDAGLKLAGYIATLPKTRPDTDQRIAGHPPS